MSERMAGSPTPYPQPAGIARGLYFDEVQVGASWHTASAQLSEHEIIRFAQEWDPHPFHIHKQAAQASVFGQLCASGLHTLLLTYRQFMSLGLFEGTTLAGLGMDKLRLLAPVLVGDSLSVRVTVEEARPASKPDHGFIQLRLIARNASDTPVLDLLLAMLIQRRAEPKVDDHAV